MIHLKLTRQDVQQLLRCLTRLQQLSPEDNPDALSLLDKLQQAQLEATQEQLCPICNASFSQDAIGRTGHYCSNACKQKAYRQRCEQRKRLYRPPTTPA